MKKTILKKTILVTITILLIILSLNYLNFFTDFEYTALDLRYKYKLSDITWLSKIVKKPKLSKQIITIDIDDYAIEKIGRWPWSWDKLQIILEACSLYSSKSCAFVDLNFNKTGNVYFNENAAVNVKNQLLNYVHKGSDTNVILGAVEVYNKRMYSTIKEYKNVFLTSKFYIPELKLTPKQLVKNTQIRKKDILNDRKNNINSMNRFVLNNVKNSSSLLTAIDFIPPIQKMNELVKGTGYNRIFADKDGIIRNYSMITNYDGKVYPSIAASMAADFFNCPIDQIKVIPGKSITFETGNIDNLVDTENIELNFPLEIPINKKGFMTINWTGAYKNSFLHIPYILVSTHFSYYLAKKILANHKMTPDDFQDQEKLLYKFQTAQQDLNTQLQNAQLTTPENSESIAMTSYYSWLMEIFLNLQYSFDDFAAGILGVDPNDKTPETAEIIKSFRNIWNQLIFNNYIVEQFNKEGNFPIYENVLKKFNLKSNIELKEAYRQTIFFLNTGRIELVRPLYFPPPSNLIIGLRSMDVSLMDISQKIVFAGLTATGLASFNPSPFETRSSMLGQPANAFNTILTNSFLKNVNLIILILIFILSAFLISFVTMRSSKLGTFIFILSIIVYPVLCWAFFDWGYILPVFSVLTNIVMSFLFSLAYKFWEAYQERKKVRDMFSTMVSPEILKIIESNPDSFKLSGELKEATMFSSDVSGFTTISEGVTAQELANILNIYLTPMSNIVMKYNGYIDKYEGDAIKADFGVLPRPDDPELKTDTFHSWKCCFSALEQQEELSVIQRLILLKFGVKISARMGVNTGIVAAGNMGSEKKRQYSVMGEAVALAEELEPINKLFDSWIAIGQTTYNQSNEYIETRFLNQLIKSEDEPLLPVYELMGWKQEKFLEYWENKPIPSLILKGIREMTPEKALAYHYYYEHKNLSDNDFNNNVKKLFSEIVPLSIEFMNKSDVLSFNSLKEELIVLDKNISDLYKNFKYDDKCKNNSEIEILEKDLKNATEKWEIYLTEQKLKLKIVMTNLIYNKFEIDENAIEDTMKMADELFKRIVCFHKRCLFCEKNDSVSTKLSSFLKETLNDIENLNKNYNIKDIETKIESLKTEINHKLNGIANFFVANSKNYHKMISEYRTVTNELLQIREIFYKARIQYVKRNFDEALKIFESILKIVPDDGPAIKYIEKIKILKNNPIPENKWFEGAWDAE